MTESILKKASMLVCWCGLAFILSCNFSCASNGHLNAEDFGLVPGSQAKKRSHDDQQDLSCIVSASCSAFESRDCSVISSSTPPLMDNLNLESLLSVNESVVISSPNVDWVAFDLEMYHLLSSAQMIIEDKARQYVHPQPRRRRVNIKILEEKAALYFLSPAGADSKQHKRIKDPHQKTRKRCFLETLVKQSTVHKKRKLHAEEVTPRVPQLRPSGYPLRDPEDYVQSGFTMHGQ